MFCTVYKIDIYDLLYILAYSQQERNLVSVKRNLFIQGEKCEGKIGMTQFCDKLSMKKNFLVEFYREKYNFSYKPHVYKIKTMTHKLLFCKLT